MVLEKFGKPDVVWLSPDCSSFSIAAISHHRRKNLETGNLDPISDYAKFCDKVDQHVLKLIKELDPTYWFIENPRGGMRKMTWMQELPRYTITYCFSGDTKVITKNGTKVFKDIVNKEYELLTKGGEWVKSKIRNYGKQQLYKLIVSRAKKKKEIFCTGNHKWLSNGREIETLSLKSGMRLDYVKTKPIQCKIKNDWVARGFTYGDGWILKNRDICFSMFCDDKQEMLKYFEGIGGKRWSDNTNKNSIIKLCSLPTEWKLNMPTLEENVDNIFSWIAGYIAADGTVGKNNSQVVISSSKKCDLEHLRDLCRVVGIDTYSINEFMRYGYGKEKTPLYQMTFMREDVPENLIIRANHKNKFSNKPKHQARRWSVLSVEKTNKIEDVYCAEVPVTNCFVLEDGILTHNCQYGDTRMKPTDIWTNHPNPKFLPMCKNGDPCHVSAPRGSRTGTQGLKGSKERSIIPRELCAHIVKICEE